MKYKIIYTCLLFVILNTHCKKDGNNTDTPGLPPATQIGANTFGCLVNGVVFKPTTRNDLSLDLDLGFKNGILNIAAYSNSTLMTVDIIDSLKFLKAPFLREFYPKQIAGIVYNDGFCERRPTDSVNYTKGFVSVSRLDYTNRVVSGFFEGILYNRTCGDTIKISNGRFDLKF